jgi:hypothetical protein
VDGDAMAKNLDLNEMGEKTPWEKRVDRSKIRRDLLSEMVECVICKTPFERKGKSKKMTCKFECAEELHRITQNNRKKKQPVIIDHCVICGGPFERRGKRKVKTDTFECSEIHRLALMRESRARRDAEKKTSSQRLD